MNYVVIIIYVLLGTIGITMSKRLFRSALAPLGLFTLLWTVFPILYMVSPLPWPKLSLRAILIMLLSLLSFGLGCLPIGLVKRGALPSSQRFVEEARLRQVVVFVGLMGLLGSIIGVVQVVRGFGAYALIYESWTVRHSLTLTGESVLGSLTGTYLLAFTFAGAIFGGFYIGYRSHRFLPAYLPLMSGAIWSLGKLGRWQMVVLILFYVISLGMGMRESGKRIKINRTIVIIMLSGLLSFSAITFLRGGLPGQDLWPYIHTDNVLVLPIVGIIERLNIPIQSLNGIVSEPPSMDFGRSMFAPLAKLLAKGNIIGDVPVYPAFVMGLHPLTPWYGPRFRPPTYLGYVYMDFGLLGVIIVSYLLGFLSSFLFLRRSILSIVAFCFIYVLLIWSFDTWLLSLTFYMGALVLALPSALYVRPGHRSTRGRAFIRHRRSS